MDTEIEIRPNRWNKSTLQAGILFSNFWWNYHEKRRVRIPYTLLIRSHLSNFWIWPCNNFPDIHPSYNCSKRRRTNPKGAFASGILDSILLTPAETPNYRSTHTQFVSFTIVPGKWWRNYFLLESHSFCSLLYFITLPSIFRWSILVCYDFSPLLMAQQVWICAIYWT